MHSYFPKRCILIFRKQCTANYRLQGVTLRWRKGISLSGIYKPTKQYLKLMRKIQAAEGVSEKDLMALILK